MSKDIRGKGDVVFEEEAKCHEIDILSINSAPNTPIKNPNPRVIPAKAGTSITTTNQITRTYTTSSPNNE